MTSRHLLAGFFTVVITTHVSHAQTPAAAAAGYPADGAPAVVTLLSSGAEPRTRLRYTIPANYAEHVKISKTATMSMGMDGSTGPMMPIPASSFMADISVTGVSAAREMTYAVVLTRIDRGVAVADPAMLAAVQGVDADYKAITGTVSVSDRGINRAVKFDFSKISSAQLGQLMASPWENITTPFPEEAIGAGARWEVRQTVNLDAAKVQQKVVYELVSVEGKRVVIKASVEQAGGPQPMANPAMPAGTEASIRQLTGTGTLTITVRLDALVPTSDTDSSRTVVADVSASGIVMSMTTEVREKLTMAPVK